jgi:NTE family protein
MKKKYKLGLALSGGGVKGFAHAGALKALEEFGYKPDIISGTSAGAVAGALYVAGYSP